MLFLNGCRETIIHNLSEIEANRCLTKLSEVSVSAYKERQPDGKWSIAVEKEDSMRAIKKLDDSRLLKDLTTSKIEKSSLVSSKEDQRFNFERSLSSEIERTMTSIEGVLEARVHLNLPATDPILGNRLPNSKGSGSILLVVNDKFSMQNDLLAQLVSGAAGIDKANISVLVSREILTLNESVTDSQLPIEKVTLSNKAAEKGVEIIEDSGHESLNWQLAVLAVGLLTAGILLLARRKTKSIPGNFNLNMDQFHEEAANAISNGFRH